MKTTERTELIDRYLLGEATTEEKMQVERLLSDPELSLEDRDKFRKEMELQKEIILAIQKQGLKEMLQQADEKKEKVDEEIEHKVHIRRLIGWTSGSITTLAAAAVIVFVIVLAPMRALFYNYSYQYAQSVQIAEATRGDELSEIASLLEQAYEAVLTNQWQQADKLSLQVMELCTQPVDNLTDEERVEYYQQAEWLHANYLMHSKHAVRAHRLLKKIADDKGLYSAQAQAILQQVNINK